MCSTVHIADVQLELSPKAPGPSLLAKMTFSYALGSEHKLYQAFAAVPTTVDSEDEQRDAKKPKMDDASIAG
jgi:hypothetical protein